MEQFKKQTFTDEKGRSVTIIHNIPSMEFGIQVNTAFAAFENWYFRIGATNFTDVSFCEYINSKRLNGMSDHYAYTVEQFERLEAKHPRKYKLTT